MELQPAEEVFPNNYFLKGCYVSSFHDRQILESMQKKAISETPNKKWFRFYYKIQTTMYIQYGNLTLVLLIVELLYQLCLQQPFHLCPLYFIYHPR